MLRRKPVIDRNHRQIEAPGYLGAHRCVGVDVANDKAAAVEEDDRGTGLPLRARIEETDRRLGARIETMISRPWRTHGCRHRTGYPRHAT